MNLLGQIQQLEFATLVAHGGEGADQFADAGAVNVVHLTEVQQNFLVAFGKQVAHLVAQHDAAFAQSDAAAEIDNGNAIDLTSAALHGHWKALLTSAATRGRA